MLPVHLHISRNVSKLGAAIPSVNLPPVITCRLDAPCVRKCYARKGRFAYPNNRALLDNNLNLWLNAPQQFEDEVVRAACPSRFFRWHSAGDIVDAEYFAMMVRVAVRTPGTLFLAFTKKYELVNAYIATHGALPANLRIVFSAWGDFLPVNPYNLPVAYVRFRKSECSIPQSARRCQHFCGECVMTGASCWTLERGESVYFDEH